MKKSKEKQIAIAKDYYDGLLSLKQIAAKHGISAKTIYNCAERYKPDSSQRNTPHNWTSVRLTRNEIELVLFLIKVHEDDLPDNLSISLPSLEDKMLTAADRDESHSRSAERKM